MRPWHGYTGERSQQWGKAGSQRGTGHVQTLANQPNQGFITVNRGLFHEQRPGRGGAGESWWWNEVTDSSFSPRDWSEEIKHLLMEAFHQIFGVHIWWHHPTSSHFLASLIQAVLSVQVPQRAEAQQEFRAEYGETQGSWGAWGAWSSCSRTCGKGVQEQSRPCLPVYAQYPTRGAGVQLQQPGHVVSALRPVAPPQPDGVKASKSSSNSRGEPRREKQNRPGERRYAKDGSIIHAQRWSYRRAAN